VCLPGDLDDVLLDLDDVSDVLVVGRVYESLGGPVLFFGDNPERLIYSVVQ
jgi:hypothetical protein